jgi:hypothetical protein
MDCLIRGMGDEVTLGVGRAAALRWRHRPQHNTDTGRSSSYESERAE